MDVRGSKLSRKFVNVFETEQSIDRLSGLPEAMLCHILSFLTIKESVATSILARRWRFLWTNFSTLDFCVEMCERRMDGDDDILSNNIQHGDSYGPSGIVYAWTGLSDIVNKLLLMQNGQVLNALILHYYLLDFTDSQIDSWITVAIAPRVKKICIHCWEKIQHARAWRNKVPVSLFRCETLVYLALTYCSVYILPNGKVSMSSLKELLLVDMHYGDDETLPRLLSGCPDLETLYIYQENFEWLAVEYLPKLIEANINFWVNDNLIAWPVDILNGFSNAKSLRLSYDGKFSDLKFEALTSKFTNLIELQLMCSDYRFTLKFLEKAENLKHLLVVYQGECRHWQEPPQVFKCLLLHLETVRVDVYRVDDDIFPLVRYLLKNGKVLKDMNVGFYDKLSTIDKDILQDTIFSIERGSPQCRIVFVRLKSCDPHF